MRAGALFLLLWSAATAVLAAATASGHEEGATPEDFVVPKLTWSQSVLDLVLTVLAPCNEHTTTLTLTNETFSLHCPTAGGTKLYKLDFTFREDVNPDRPKCRTKGSKYVCVVVKRHQHMFDHLMVPEDEAVFKGMVERDWGGDDVLETEEWLNWEGYKSKRVSRLESEDALAEELRKGRMVVLDLSFPWCDRCGTKNHKAFVGAAKHLEHNTTFVHMDARENRKLARQFSITCVKCVYHILNHGPGEALASEDLSNSEVVALAQEGALVVEGKQSGKELAQEVVNKALPPYLTLADELEWMEVQQEILKEGSLVVRMEPEEGEEDSEGNGSLKQFVRIARSNGFPGTRFVVLSRDLAYSVMDKPESTLEIHTAMLAPAKHALAAPTSSLTKFIATHSLPLFEYYDWSKREQMVATGLPVIKYYANVDRQTPMSTRDWELFHFLAEQYRGRLIFVWVDRTGNADLGEAGVDKDALPQVVAIDTLDWGVDDIKRYVFRGVDYSIGALRQFCDDYLANVLRPSRKSQPAPEHPHRPGTVRTVVYDTFDDEVLDTKEEVLLLVFKAWQDATERDQLLDTMVDLLGDTEGVVVARMDGSENHIDLEFFNLTRYWSDDPLFLVVGEGSNRRAIRYRGTLKAFPVFKFVKREGVAVQANWHNIKHKVLEFRDEKKREQREEEEERLEQIAARAVRLEGMEPVDVSGDGGVLKYVFKEGDGDLPGPGMLLSAHYTGMVAGGDEFDSSYRRKPLEFSLGLDQVIKCWDQAFATMRKGEHAWLKCDPQYAYGDEGSPPSIPPNAKLEFEVELMDTAFPTKEEL